MSSLNLMYQKKLLDEAKNPYHFEKIEEATTIIRAYNPICGDRYDLYLGEKIFFHGFGCTISKSSTSFMIRLLEDRNDQEKLELVRHFLRALREGLPISISTLKLFENKEHFKGRLDCIKLSWEVMEQYLSDKDSEISR